MILTCPSCSASYNVDNAQIGPEGREVRCKKCKHVWFQVGEKQKLEDLINLVQSTHIDVDIDFDDDKKSSKPKIAKNKKSPSEGGILQKLILSFIKNRFASVDKKTFLNHFSGAMVALAIFMCLLFGLVSQRFALTAHFPSLIAPYEAAGFPIVNYARINPEEALIIDRVMIDGEGEKRQIIGSLINLTSQNVKVPAFKLSFMDEKGQILGELKYQMPVSVLNKELSANFAVPVPEKAQKGLSSVKIVFTD